MKTQKSNSNEPVGVARLESPRPLSKFRHLIGVAMCFFLIQAVAIAAEMTLMLAPFSTSASEKHPELKIDETDLEIELNTARLLNHIRVLPTNQFLKSTSQIGQLHSIDFGDEPPSMLLIVPRAAKRSDGTVIISGILTTPTSQIRAIRVSGTSLIDAIDNLFKDLDQPPSNSFPILAGVWKDPSTDEVYTISQSGKDVFVRLLDSPNPIPVDRWVFAKGELALAPEGIVMRIETMTHGFEYQKQYSLRVLGNETWQVENTGRKIMRASKSMLARISKDKALYIEGDGKRCKNAIGVFTEKLLKPMQSRDRVRVANRLAHLQKGLGDVWMEGDVDQLQREFGESQFALEIAAYQSVPGSELFAGLPIMGHWRNAQPARPDAPVKFVGCEFFLTGDPMVVAVYMYYEENPWMSVDRSYTLTRLFNIDRSNTSKVRAQSYGPGRFRGYRGPAVCLGDPNLFISNHVWGVDKADVEKRDSVKKVYKVAKAGDSAFGPTELSALMASTGMEKNIAFEHVARTGSPPHFEAGETRVNDLSMRFSPASNNILQFLFDGPRDYRFLIHPNYFSIISPLRLSASLVPSTDLEGNPLGLRGQSLPEKALRSLRSRE
jgi:hypothetical protein